MRTGFAGNIQAFRPRLGDCLVSGILMEIVARIEVAVGAAIVAGAQKEGALEITIDQGRISLISPLE